MKIAARRRLAVGVVATTSAMLAGVLIAPSSTAANNGLVVSPSGVSNGDTSEVITFDGTDVRFTFGGTATFTLGNTSFDVEIEPDPDPRSLDQASATVDFTDVADGVPGDGPADAGTYNVTVTGAGESSPGSGGSDNCTSCFTVLPAAPLTVTSVAPNSLRPGQAGNVSIAGNGFERSSRIDVLFPDSDFVDPSVNANNAPVVSGTADTTDVTTRTELQRRVVVAANAQAGVRDVRVTNLNGTSAICQDCFFVSGAELTSSNPTAARNDPTQALTTITFTGSSIAANGTPRLEFVGAPGAASRSQLTIVGQNVRDRTTTSITADYDLRNAAPGSNAYQPFVQGDGGVVNACQASCRFTVLQDGRAPTLTSLDRSTDAGVQKNLQAGETATFTATGTNFSKGTTLVFAAADVLTVTGVEFVSPERLLVTVSAASGSPAGDKDPQARLTDGQTSPVCDNCLTVTAANASPGPSASATPTATTSASPRPSASAGPRVDARYAGLNSPVRVLDTRSNRGPRRSGEIVLNLSQRITDPNATAAVLNVTVTNPTARGFLVAYPNGNAKPGTSNVNFEANQTQANEVVVGLGTNRSVALFVDSASAHVVVDLVGFFTTTSSTDTGRLTTNAPVRALDTRSTSTPRRTGEVVLDLSGQLPAGATDAVLNVTVQGPSARGFVVVYPTGTTRPGTSNVNFERGQTQANEVFTRVGTGSNAGRVSLFIDSATSALIVDVVGAVTPGSTAGSQVYTALQQPTRALDTRDNRGARRSGNVDVTMPSSVPSGATGVVLNVTATNGTRSGFVTVFPAGAANPGTSNVNFPVNRTQANEVTTALGNNRSVTLFVGGSGTPAAHLIVDVVGYLTGTGAAPAPSSTASASGSASPRPSTTATATTSPRPSTTAAATPTSSATTCPTDPLCPPF
jgi:hypothetical protein